MLLLLLLLLPLFCSPMDGREGSAPQGLREPLLEPSSWEEEQRVAEANSSYHGSPVSRELRTCS